MISYFARLMRNNWYKRLLIGLLATSVCQRSSGMGGVGEIAIGTLAAEYVAVVLVPLIMTGSLDLAHQLSQSTRGSRQFEPIPESSAPEAQVPGLMGKMLISTTVEDIQKTQQMIDFLNKGTEAIGQSVGDSPALVKAIEEQIQQVSSNLKLSIRQTQDMVQSLLIKLKHQQIASLKATDYKAWESITQSVKYQKEQDAYYFKSQQLVDSMHRAFFAKLELNNKEVNAKIFKGASSAAIIVYRILGSLLVQPLKNIAWQTRQDQAVQSLLQADPALKSAYTYAMKHVTHQIVQVINPKETIIKRAENLILLNQVNMEGKFGRNCRSLTAQLNYLFCDNDGCIDFAKFNDKAANAQAIKLMEEFFRFTADDHEAYVDYCKTAAQSAVPSMQAIVTQASQGTRFSIGQSNFSRWKEQVFGTTRHAIDPTAINAQKLNRDFLTLIGHLRADEFDPRADMNLNYWKAWQLRSKYMRLADSIVEPALKSKVNEQAIVMHNLFGDYYHKNRAKYNCWDSYNCEVYIDQAGVIRAYPQALNALAKQYGLTRSHILYLNRSYNVSPETLAEICSDQSKKASLEQLAQEIKSDYSSKITGQSVAVKDIILSLQTKSTDAIQNQCIGNEPEILIKPDIDGNNDKPYFPPASIGHMPPIGGNLPEHPICPDQDIPEIPIPEPDDISIPHPEEDCIWSQTAQLPPIVGATVGHGDGGPEMDPNDGHEAASQIPSVDSLPQEEAKTITKVDDKDILVEAPTSTIDPESKAKDDYLKGIEKLTETYGEAKVKEIIEILKIKDSKIATSNDLVESIEECILDLIKINSDPRRALFKYDPANGNKVSWGSIIEALAAIEFEERTGIKLKRSLRRGEDFVDELGTCWDVKTGYSRDFYKRISVFDIDSIYDTIIKEYERNENPIVNISILTEKDSAELLKKLNGQLTPEQKERTFIANYKNPSQSGFLKG